jgi:metal-responsive CopG/Arc/MetJ family transcriptional regulator
MPRIDVTLPDEVLAEFEMLVDEEFISEEQAVEELLTMGIDAYRVDEAGEDIGQDFIEVQNNLFDTAADPGNIDHDRL